MTNPGDFLGLSADAWMALGTWATVLVALTAGVLALRQLREVRRQRLEASQPYVAVALQPTEADPAFVDLVIRNFGVTAAYDIEIEMEPAPERHKEDGSEVVWVPKKIPTLVPGQEWATWWDSGYQRYHSPLPKQTMATVRYLDSTGHEFNFEYLLDWTPYLNSGRVVTYGPHHSAKALREIEKLLKGWTRDSAQGSLSVLVRDGDARDASRSQAWAERQDSKTDSSSEEQ